MNKSNYPQLQATSLDEQNRKLRLWVSRLVIFTLLTGLVAGLVGFRYGRTLGGAEAAQKFAAEKQKLLTTMQPAIVAETGPQFPRPNAKETNKLLQQAGTGDVAAQLELARAYFSGKGVEAPSLEAGKHWLTKSAMAGHLPALIAMAEANLNGSFGKTDRRSAARWLEAAASSGHAGAAHRLGQLFEGGLDGAPDSAQALGWYQRAAALGSNDALAAIARLVPKRHQITREDIKDIQENLRTLGYDVGAADGRMGRRTVEAIRAYQVQTGMIVDGRPSYTLRERLADDLVAQGG